MVPERVHQHTRRLPEEPLENGFGSAAVVVAVPVVVVEIARSGAGRLSRTLRAPCTLHVGSSSACDLRVVARGVRARHLALDWDGAQLSLVNEPGGGPVRIDGRIVRPPLVLFGSVKLEIGDAEVYVTAPLSPEDETTLVMDRDWTGVPCVPSPPRNDAATEISERPWVPVDATTTQRVRHHRSRLDAVCVPLDIAEGRARKAVKARLARLRPPAPFFLGGVVIVVGLTVLFLAAVCLHRIQ